MLRCGFCEKSTNTSGPYKNWHQTEEKMRTYQPKRGKMVISIGSVLTLSVRNSVSIVWYFLQIQSKMHIILVYLMHHLDFAQIF